MGRKGYFVECPLSSINQMFSLGVTGYKIIASLLKSWREFELYTGRQETLQLPDDKSLIPIFYAAEEITEQSVCEDPEGDQRLGV